jgi:hypothetical protein
VALFLLAKLQPPQYLIAAALPEFSTKIQIYLYILRSSP